MSLPLIHLHEVYKTYAQGEQRIEVLTGLNLSVQRGETLAIVGQSGSGKSSLLALLGGLARPDGGLVQVEGQDMASMSEKSLAAFRAARLGIVFQQFHLMSHLSALENVMLPLEIRGQRSPRAPAEAALAAVGLSHRLAHLPAQLSGGERQRVAMARAFVARPALLLADEPSGNLDQKTGEQVMELLFQLIAQEAMTMILVTHNLDLARRCQRLLHLRDGLLHEEPTNKDA